MFFSPSSVALTGSLPMFSVSTVGSTIDGPSSPPKRRNGSLTCLLGPLVERRLLRLGLLAAAIGL